MRSAEQFETLFEKYYGHLHLYLKWYTDNTSLENEIIEKTFIEYMRGADDNPSPPAAHLDQIAREVAIALTKDIRLTIEETNRRILLFAFLDPISSEERNVYLEKFYRNTSNSEIAIKFEVSEIFVSQTIRQIAKIHGRFLFGNSRHDNITD